MQISINLIPKAPIDNESAFWLEYIENWESSWC